jgi:hypothetical protein
VEAASSRLAATSVSTGPHTAAGSCGHNVVRTMIEALMVEASQVDWACHTNDPAHLISDLMMFEEAVKTAVDFAQQDGSTLVLAFSDHNTGGFFVGNMATSGTYSQMTPDALLRPLRSDCGRSRNRPGPVEPVSFRGDRSGITGRCNCS